MDANGEGVAIPQKIKEEIREAVQDAEYNKKVSMYEKKATQQRGKGGYQGGNRGGRKRQQIDMIIQRTQAELKRLNNGQVPDQVTARKLLDSTPKLVEDFNAQFKTKGGRRKFVKYAGEKVLDEFSKKMQDGSVGSRLTDAQIKDLQAIIGDDFWSVISPYLLQAAKVGGSSILNYAVPKITKIVQQSAPYQWIRNKLVSFGSDLLNDHQYQPLLGQETKQIIQMSQNLSRSSFSAVGVNINALKASLHPSKYSARFPVDIRPTGVICRPSQFTLTTNASGNCACVIQPYNLFIDTYYGGIMNDATYNPVTGGQTPASTNITPPYLSLKSGVNGFSLVGFEMQITAITNQFNNQGQFRFNASHEGMTEAPFRGTVDIGFLSETQMLAQPYVVTGAVKDLKLTFNFIPPGQDMFDFHDTTNAIWSSTSELDHAFQACLQIVGGAPSTQIALITVYPLIQFTPDKTTIMLIDLTVADPGIYTKHFCEQLIIYNKNICLFGQEELDALCSAFDNCEPDFDSLFKIAMKAETKMINQSTGYMPRGRTTQAAWNPMKPNGLKHMKEEDKPIEKQIDVLQRQVSSLIKQISDIKVRETSTKKQAVKQLDESD